MANCGTIRIEGADDGGDGQPPPPDDGDGDGPGQFVSIDGCGVVTGEGGIGPAPPSRVDPGDSARLTADVSNAGTDDVTVGIRWVTGGGSVVDSTTVFVPANETSSIEVTQFYEDLADQLGADTTIDITAERTSVEVTQGMSSIALTPGPRRQARQIVQVTGCRNLVADTDFGDVEADITVENNSRNEMPAILGIYVNGTLTASDDGWRFPVGSNTVTVAFNILNQLGDGIHDIGFAVQEDLTGSPPLPDTPQESCGSIEIGIDDEPIAESVTLGTCGFSTDTVQPGGSLDLTGFVNNDSEREVRVQVAWFGEGQEIARAPERIPANTSEVVRATISHSGLADLFGVDRSVTVDAELTSVVSLSQQDIGPQSKRRHIRSQQGLQTLRRIGQAGGTRTIVSSERPEGDSPSRQEIGPQGKRRHRESERGLQQLLRLG